MRATRLQATVSNKFNDMFTRLAIDTVHECGGRSGTIAAYVA